MQYSFKKVNINAPFATTACGHSCQTKNIYVHRDNQYARILAFKDDKNWIIHVSFDLLGIYDDTRLEIQRRVRKHYHRSNIYVITSTTHTHYANSCRDSKYIDYLTNLISDEITKMRYIDVKDVKVSFQLTHTTACGKSRISNYETNNEYLCLLRFYNDTNNFATIVINNAHPTTLDANVDYFSSEYPGYVLKKLEEEYPDTDFTFMMGPAGDISSRFVRSGQDYNAMIELGNKLFDEIKSELSKDIEKSDLQLNLDFKNLYYDHEFTPIDIPDISNLSEREQQTINIGQEARRKLEEKVKANPTSLVREVVVTTWNTGAVKLIFYPNEMFSEYLNYIDLNNDYIISYSNGYGPYILPMDFKHVTYEMFTDTLTKETKQRLVELLKKL